MRRRQILKLRFSGLSQPETSVRDEVTSLWSVFPRASLAHASGCEKPSGICVSPGSVGGNRNFKPPHGVGIQYRNRRFASNFGAVTCSETILEQGHGRNSRSRGGSRGDR